MVGATEVGSLEGGLVTGAPEVGSLEGGLVAGAPDVGRKDGVWLVGGRLPMPSPVLRVDHTGTG